MNFAIFFVLWNGMAIFIAYLIASYMERVTLTSQFEKEIKA